MARRGAQPGPDPLELVVLSVLREEPAYGYLIIKRVAARSGEALRLTPGALYPLLHDMEAQGLVAARWETVRSERADASGAGRPRKWYRLTAKGRRRLEKRIDAHRAYQRLIEDFLPGAGAEGAP